MRIVSSARNRNASCIRYAIALVAALVVVSGCGRKSVEDQLQAGDQARQSSRLGEAESNYLAAIQTAPTDARPHTALGSLYAFESKLGSAENQYRAAVALAPGDASLRMALGDVLRKAQQAGAAESELRTAVGLAPGDAHTHLALANLLASEPNRQQEAQNEYAQVKALDASLLPASPTPSPAATTAPMAPPPSAPAARPATPPKLRTLDKRFLLTKNSPVYQSPASTSSVVAQVHRGKLVHVTGITGDWLRVQLKTGVVGYIPVSAAE